MGLDLHIRAARIIILRMGDLELSKSIMLEFASNTGLEPAAVTPRRYLWTDGFAVCNFLELYGQTKDVKFLDLALALADQVHHTLGKHRVDDLQKRHGWISGLSEEEGELHPTQGGLRIGKKLPERLAMEPFDDDAEWDKDGQYYHYLTKWMQALSKLHVVTTDRKYLDFGAELVGGIHTGFCRILATHYNLDFQIWKLFQPALVSVINFHIWKSRL